MVKGLRFIFLFLSISQLLAAQVANTSAPTQTSERLSDRIVLRGNVHPLARAEADRGAAPDELPQRRMLLLLQRSAQQESELQRLLEEQQTKSSSNYQNWISPEEFGRRFGSSDADIQRAIAWLTSNGFQIEKVSEGRGIIEFSGTAGQVRGAFHTEIHKFLVNGEEHWANNSDPQIPVALGSVVRGVVSLNNFRRTPSSHPIASIQESPLAGELQPNFTFTPSGTQLHGMGPGDFATIYNVQPLWNAGIDGTGQTIAIVAESNINVSDVQSFRSLFGLPANPPQIVVDGDDPGVIPGPETEAVADVEWAGAVAKNATIDLVVSAPTATTSGVDLSALYIVQHNLAPVLSMSFGDCEATLGATENAFINELWKQAAAQGITVVVSTGDNLSAGCDDPNGAFATHGLAVNGGASTPYNVAVGGTDFNLNGSPATYWNSSNDPVTSASAKSYIPEITWNDSCAKFGISGCANNATTSSNSGGSGGQSSIYAKPSWQTGPGVPADGKRDLPDVSLFAAASANSSFYLICESDQNLNKAPCNLNLSGPELLPLGGTSISAQAFGGIMALINQYQESHGHASRQGNANYVLYQLAAKSNASCDSSSAPLGASSCIFYDVTQGTNSADCFITTTPNCGGPGPVTGVLVDPNNPSVAAWTADVGFDLATGLGSVNAQNLAANWSSAAFTPTATTLTLSPTTITHGQPATVNIAVAPNPGSGTPSGDVSLIASTGGSGRSAGVFTLRGGTVTNQTTSSLAGGTYSLVAHYAGDGSFAGSDSSPVSVTVNPEPSSTLISLITFDGFGKVLNTNASSAQYGSPYILRADVGNATATRGNLCASANALACPTGTVSLISDGSSLDGGVFNLNSQGFTEDVAVQLSGGTHNLQAQYSGDSSYGSSSAAATLTITPGNVSVFGQSTGACCVLVGSPVTLALSVSSSGSGAPPTGTVSVFDNNSSTASATATLSPSPNKSPAAGANVTLTLNTPGVHTFRLQYSGDQNYAANSGIAPGVDAQYKPTLTISANPPSVAYPNTTTVTAVLHTGQVSPKPNMTMQFYGVFANAPVAPTYSYITDPDGTTALQETETFTPITNLNVSSFFGGDPNYQQAQSGDVQISVTGAPDFSLSASPTSLSLPRGQSATSTVTLSALNGFTGSVNFSCIIQGSSVFLSCTANPDPVTIAAGSSTAAVTITLAAPQTATQRNRWRSLGFVSFGFLAVVLLIPQRKWKRKARLGLIFPLALFLGSLSCGGGGSSGGNGSGTQSTTAAPQTATVAVTATTFLNQFALSHTTTISLTVQ